MLVISTYGNGIYKRFLPSSKPSSSSDHVNLNKTKFIKNITYAGGVVSFDYLHPGLKGSTLTISDLAGKVLDRIAMEDKTPGNYTMSYRLSSCTSGMYVLSIQHGNKLLDAQKFVIAE